jgi:hypothetical protein
MSVFLKTWWVESDIKASNLPLSLRLKGSAVTITVFITILEQNRDNQKLTFQEHRLHWALSLLCTGMFPINYHNLSPLDPIYANVLHIYIVT